MLIFLVLSDSKLDLALANARNAVMGHYSLTEKEMLRKEIPMTVLWEKIEMNDSKVVDYIISDWYSSSYYLPKGVRLHTAKQSFGAEFLLKCDHVEELTLLKKYKYSLLYFENNNLCYKFIRKYGILLTELNGLKLFLNPYSY